MPICVALSHKTVYSYDKPVKMGPQLIRLRPAPHCRTEIESYSLRIEPERHYLNWQQDPFSNWQARAVFPEPVDLFSVEVDLVAKVSAVNPFDFFIEDVAKKTPFKYPKAVLAELAPFMAKPVTTRKFKRYVRGLPTKERLPTVEYLVALNQKLQDDIGYTIRMEPGVQTPEQTLTLGTGSCRDSAWLLVHILRSLGMASRFVSGYLLQLQPDADLLGTEGGPNEDVTDLHAWAEVYLPGAGWIGLDPTSGLLAGEGHLPLVATPEPSSAAPISGGVDPCEVEFSHDMHIRRLHETPRVTKPFTEQQWQSIDALGSVVDKALQDNDVRLTMGGEPTFVSEERPDAAEWNTEANGHHKLHKGEELLKRLHNRFGKGGVLQFNQGKWYPGESLPRWAWSLYWRKDKEPLWRNADLLLPDKAATLDQAEQLMQGVASKLGIPHENIVTAYEDTWHFLGLERKLPEGDDPLNNDLSDPEVRARLARVYEKGLNAPRGFVLPVQKQQATAGRRGLLEEIWLSEKWPLRDGKLWLVPGDSPLGLRLPLSSLPQLSEKELPRVMMQDPFAAKPSLPTREELSEQPRGARNDKRVTTALCIEPQPDGLQVFLPPTNSAADFSALLAVIEDTAESLKLPVKLSGYAPPSDSRLDVLKVTPDPGVLEINVQPSASWNELKTVAGGLYEDAAACQLRSEKFLQDGAHRGSGGGNHIVVGAAQPEDSPFLRRPDLLGSVIRYVQNHPSLSYLFAGQFIGPTSQASRVDEGRDDVLEELELALAQLPTKDATNIPSWLVDRILRNLLIDLTGNTHRAEICIDKLYSPDGPAGRLGLVEFRGFEMPPHPRMALLQQLLIRALIAWFWVTPYQRPLLRFGSRLRDRWMLPHYLWQDMGAVVSDLQSAGFQFELEWFKAQQAFRFPVLGQFQCRGMTIEISEALEAWPVMGEESSGGGTARYVDSSVSRIQIRVTQRSGDRYSVLCNRYPVPLTSTGESDEFVAGVRYRGWQPWSCLHPTIPAHTPITVEVYDNWNQRSVGGCSLHLGDPGGRNTEVLPVNALEAESRRATRFQPFGHSTGQFQPHSVRSVAGLKFTLDLRYQQ